MRAGKASPHKTFQLLIIFMRAFPLLARRRTRCFPLKIPFLPSATPCIYPKSRQKGQYLIGIFCKMAATIDNKSEPANNKPVLYDGKYNEK
ncbi:hypothetical protein [Mixta sp. Marseille-Q2659]|uniref:hypothetical protein n=1 Tax=Mixta sp. Marseille-Q2659 TaxID=2736607 RepID=UPI0023B930A0|nr:hypothetical protein [Mixta sp. Marseille-Q2659]